MEHKDKFQKKFSDFRHAVASKSPANKSRSNSVIKRNNTKVIKVKDTQNTKPKIEKKTTTSKIATLNNSVQNLLQPTTIRDLQIQLSTLNSTLKHLPIGSVKEITSYYQIIKEFIKQMVESPLYNVMKLLHSIYTIPLPTLITKNDFNTKIYTELSQQSQISELLNKSKDSLSKYKNSSTSKLSNILTTNTSTIMEPQPFLSKQTSSKKIGFKLNMNRIQETKENVKDYFDEFYDNINEFSQSWRTQALKEKR